MKPSKIIKQLEENGCEVEITHQRNWLHSKSNQIVLMSKDELYKIYPEQKDKSAVKKPFEILGQGGHTRVIITKNDEKLIGVYNVPPTKRFVRVVGIVAAIGRALKNSELKSEIKFK